MAKKLIYSDKMLHNIIKNDNVLSELKKDYAKYAAVRNSILISTSHRLYMTFGINIDIKDAEDLLK